MRKIIVFLLLVSFAFSNLYGPSQMIYEKTWKISGQKGTHIELDGIFIINNSNQKVISITKPPETEIYQDNDGVIKLLYNGTLEDGKKEITASATVNVFYAMDLPADGEYTLTAATPTEYTEYTAEMSTLANSLADKESTYATARNLTEWTHRYITYDLNYFGENSPAEKVFSVKRGVCVEYSHLTIALMNSVGIKTRYVSGYVYSREWQPHAWIEVELPNGDKIPIDPTFDEAQNLDNSHIATYYSNDQSEVFDKITSDKKVQFESNESITPITSEKSKERPVKVEMKFNETEERIDVNLINEKGKDLFVSYEIAIPTDAGKGEQTLLLFKPGESKQFHYYLNKGYVKPGFVYNIPILVSVNDFETKNDLVVVKNGEGKPKNNVNSVACFPGMAIIAALVFAVRRR